MVNMAKNRIREAPEASGMISRNQAAKKYNVDPSIITRWTSKGEVVVAKIAAYQGDTVLLDEGSLRKRLQLYQPHKDNQARRARTRPVLQLQYQQLETREPITRNSHNLTHVEERGGSSAGNGLGAAPSSAPGAVLITKEWVEKYYEDQARRSGGTINPETRDSYDWVFDRFTQKFTELPLDRKELLDYLHGLTNLKRGGPLSGGAKMLVHRQLSAFYHWLEREHGYRTPNLTHHGIINKRESAIAVKPDEIRQIMDQARDHAEYTIFLLQAQTGCRIGELCTIRPELIHDHWVGVFGKPTRANPTGYRKLPLPDAAYDHLQRELRTWGRLVWVDGRGRPRDLSGDLEQVNPRRAIDTTETDDPKTYVVKPAPGAVSALQGLFRVRMKEAGVYEQGKLTHGFRRAYEAEFLLNGGKPLFMDRILGHFNKANMADLYFNVTTEDLVAHAREFAPRQFLNEAASQGELALAVGN